LAQTALFYRLGVALAIGFLVGLQREYAHGGPGREIAAGERTLALMGLVGCLAALVADELGSPWAFVGAVVPLGALITVSYFVGARQGDVGMTTEVAGLVTVLAGAMCYWGYLEVAAAVAVATTVLLSLKLETDRLVRLITREDIRATLTFAVITVIVLPVLPDRGFGPVPFDVLNPYEIWLMVVFISGISFLGYVLVKAVGPQQGIGLTGLLGGVASSTAVTLSFAERSQGETGLDKPFAQAIIVAWVTMFPRVLLEVAAVNSALLKDLWLPMGAAMTAGLIYSAYLYLSQRTAQRSEVAFSNPFRLGPALKFGLLYAVVLLISRAAQVWLGNTGVYISSVVGGLADADAITLSMSQLSREGGLSTGAAAQGVVLAAMSNTAAKGGIVLVSGSPTLRKTVLPGFVLMLVTGIGVALLL